MNGNAATRARRRVTRQPARPDADYHCSALRLSLRIMYVASVMIPQCCPPSHLT